MVFYLKIAFRNIFRNKVRSYITLGAIAFGCISLILTGGFINDALVKLRESLIHSQFGHIQIYKKGYFEKGSAKPFDYLIENYRDLEKQIRGIPHVKNIANRLQFSGLLSNGENTISFLGQGVDPEGEKELSSWIKIEHGEMISANDAYGAILGRGLAASLDAKVGDFLTILTNTRDGAINAIDIKVRGIFYSFSKEYDDRVLKLPLDTAQKLLYLDAAQAMVVLLDETESTDEVKRALANMFEENRFPLEVKTWADLADYYNKLVKLYKRQFGVLKFIISIVVVLSIINTMSMSIFERTREIGTIMAMGTKKNEVLSMFMLEGLVLGLLGGGIGVILGIISAKIISFIGIPMPPAPGSTVGYVAAIGIFPKVIITAFLFSVVTALAASFYPSFKASRLNISEALRYI
ncbi:MAG: ABC transporter permease [Proteobacteria bacterium]|nr:ABC transporter permease [Pseudomonadota bacterium]